MYPVYPPIDRNRQFQDTLRKGQFLVCYILWYKTTVQSELLAPPNIIHDNLFPRFVKLVILLIQRHKVRLLCRLLQSSIANRRASLQSEIYDPSLKREHESYWRKVSQ